MSVVQKWGNSLGVRIPSEVIKRTGIHSGDEVFCEVENDVILIRKKKKKISLDSLLNEISDDNIHEEVQTGHALGRELIS